MSKVKYRVYKSKEGQQSEFCGEFSHLTDAVAFAETEPAGLPESSYDSARECEAGHCGGLYPPSLDGDESDDPISWHGANGFHCVVKTTYPESGQ